MKHEEIGDLIDLWLDNELPAATAALIASHVGSCPVCTQTVEQSCALSARIRSAGRREAPADLAQNALAACQLDTPSASGRLELSWLSRVAANLAAPFAAAVAAAFATWWLVVPATTHNQTLSAYVDAHIRALLQQTPVQVVSGDTHKVKPWFAGKLEFDPPVSNPDHEGFPLQGGRVEFMNGHRAAALVYKRREHLIDLYVWPGKLPLRAAASSRGYNIHVWEADGFAFMALSGLNQAELAEFSAKLRR